MEVKAIEEYRQVSAPPAHYYPAPEDRSRKAVFYANLYQAEKRPLYQNASIGMELFSVGGAVALTCYMCLLNMALLRLQFRHFTHLLHTLNTALHEGVPGHHMQIALAQEMKNLPRLRKNAVVRGICNNIMARRLRC
jgi:uncharacterized protein (DUF885 family)